ncbi:MAG TPA: OprD family porin [Pseudomonas sp.]
MSLTPLARAVALATLGAGMILPSLAQADFVKDSKASLELKNFYFNRDFRSNTSGNHKAEEWAQGFILRMESGYTEGTIGMGVDAIGTLGLQLDSGRGTSGTGLLLRDRETGQPQDSYGDLGVTAKFKASNSVLKVGTLIPKLPSVSASESRLLPQSFQGAHLNSQEIAGLTLDIGQLNRINNRDSQDHQAMVITSGGRRNIRFAPGTDSDAMTFAGASYKWNSQLTTAYHYGNLDEFYRQHIFNVVHVLPIADGQSFKSDLRYARSLDDESSNVDNKAMGALFTYTLQGHSFGLGYQSMSGDTGYAYVGDSTDPFLVNYVQISDFANRDEKSWQARYDFNFATVGIPGLTFMTRYLSGDNVELGGTRAEGKEWERDSELKYVFQEGTLKNLGIHWRNATVRSNFASDLDENRLIVSYTLPLL